MEINHWVTRRTMTVKRLDACLTRLSLPIKDCSPDPYISYTKRRYTYNVLYTSLCACGPTVLRTSAQRE